MPAHTDILRFLSFGWLTGPILYKEIRTSSRRGHYYWLRLCYIALLAAYVAMVWLGSVEEVNPATAEGQARIAQAGRNIVSSIVWFQFLTMQLFTIVLLSDSISGEITGRTIIALMTSPITSLQIVVGKLLSGMLQIFLLLAISLPLLAIVRVLGGIPWDYLAAGLCLTLCASLLAGMITMLLSIRFRQPYVTILLAVTIEAVVFGMGGFGGAICCCAFAPLHFVDPFGSLACITDEFMSSEPLSVEKWVIPCIATFCAFEGLLCLCVIRVGRLALRREPAMKDIAIKPDVRRDDLAGELKRLEKVSGKSPPPQPLAPTRIPPAPPSVQPPPRLIDQLQVAASTVRSERVLELDFRPVSEIKANPVLWREMNKGAIKWSSWMRTISLYVSIPLVIAALAFWTRDASCFGLLLAVVGMGVGIFMICTSQQRAKHVISLLIALATIPLLILPHYLEWLLLLFCALATAIPAATNIAIEKESRTLELLYTTGLSDWQILSGKAGGVFLRSWPFWLCLLVIPFYSFVIYIFLPLALLMSILLVTAMMIFVIALGQFCSILSRKATSSAALCITILAALWVVAPLIGYNVLDLSGRYIGLFSPVRLMIHEDLFLVLRYSSSINKSAVPPVNFILEYPGTIAAYLAAAAVMLLLARTFLRAGACRQK